MRPKLAILISGLLIIATTLFVACTKDGTASNASTGKGGSLTRFTISGDHLYVVDNHFLYAYSLLNPQKPERVYTSPLNFDIETIYPFKNYLFLGTRTGLYVYSIDTAAKPRLIGEARHARSCDPVVANDSVAFVTLKGSAICGPATSGLYINDITNINKPILRKTIELPDPVGLGLQDSILYVCCGPAGLKVFNVKQPYSPTLISTAMDGKYVDVIPYNGILICFVEDGIILYDITKPDLPQKLNKIVN
ncbi:hypothetical protein EXU57_06830 [Segetibacter sp. 3557_3]|uniref:hypothetical protein n=1 Tax=Segetibacter sp. 3557_3 TaxID=2547429 RepID=UPI001058873B|nr:hypothetical protein [Segetibacter sp. 3557_3]TDH27298.1 hypothetical protein EXU57_06830 [Segetibacter sp. 3557_3]